jgi:hypothetical protein
MQEVPEQQRLSEFDTLTVVETSVISAMLTADTFVPYEKPWSSFSHRLLTVVASCST